MPAQVVEQHPDGLALGHGEVVEGQRQFGVALTAGLVLEDREAGASLELARDRGEQVLERDVGRLGTPEIAQADSGVGRVAGHAETLRRQSLGWKVKLVHCPWAMRHPLRGRRVTSW